MFQHRSAGSWLAGREVRGEDKGVGELGYRGGMKYWALHELASGHFCLHTGHDLRHFWMHAV